MSDAALADRVRKWAAEERAAGRARSEYERIAKLLDAKVDQICGLVQSETPRDRDAERVEHDALVNDWAKASEAVRAHETAASLLLLDLRNAADREAEPEAPR